MVDPLQPLVPPPWATSPAPKAPAAEDDATPSFADAQGGSGPVAQSSNLTPMVAPPWAIPPAPKVQAQPKLPKPPAPPAAADPDFQRWYQNFSQSTGKTLSFDQARQIYKTLPKGAFSDVQAGASSSAPQAVGREAKRAELAQIAAQGDVNPGGQITKPEAPGPLSAFAEKMGLRDAATDPFGRASGLAYPAAEMVDYAGAALGQSVARPLVGLYSRAMSTTNPEEAKILDVEGAAKQVRGALDQRMQTARDNFLEAHPNGVGPALALGTEFGAQAVPFVPGAGAGAAAIGEGATALAARAAPRLLEEGSTAAGLLSHAAGGAAFGGAVGLGNADPNASLGDQAQEVGTGMALGGLMGGIGGLHGHAEGRAIGPDRLQAVHDAFKPKNPLEGLPEKMLKPVTQHEVLASEHAGVEPAYPGYGGEPSQAFGAWLDRGGLTPDDVSPRLQKAFFEIHNPEDLPREPASSYTDGLNEKALARGGPAPVAEEAPSGYELNVLGKTIQIPSLREAPAAIRDAIFKKGARDAEVPGGEQGRVPEAPLGGPAESAPGGGPEPQAPAEPAAEVPAAEAAPGRVVTPKIEPMIQPPWEAEGAPVEEAHAQVAKSQEPLPDAGRQENAHANDGQEAKAVGQPPEQPATGIKNAVVAADRAARGLNPEVEVEMRRSIGSAWEAGKEAVDNGTRDPRKLARELAKNPRPLTAEEIGSLVYDRARLGNEVKATHDAIEKAAAAGDEKAAAQGRLHLVDLMDHYNENDYAARRTGYEQGLGLRARQMMAREDYSLANVEQRARVAGGATAGEKAHLAKLSKELEAGVEQHRVYQEGAAARESEKAVAAMKKDAAYETRKTRRAVTKEQLGTEFESLQKEFAKKAGKLHAGVDPDLAIVMTKMAKNRVRAGLTTAEEVVDSIYQVVRHHVEGITPRDVRDAISGYGRVQEASHSELQARVAEVNRQMKLLSAFEDAQKGERPARGGNAPREESARVKELKAQVKAEMEARGIRARTEPEQQALWKRQLTKRRAEMQKQLADKSFKRYGRQPQVIENEEGKLVRVTRRPYVMDAENTRLKVQNERIKLQIDNTIKRIENRAKGPLSKTYDKITKIRRAIVLSSLTTTPEKIAAAAGWSTFVSTPIRSIVNLGLSHAPLMKQIAERAPREGVHSFGQLFGDEMKAFGQAFKKETWADVKEAAKTGHSSLDLLYDKKGSLPHEHLDMFGHFHAALKTLPKRAEFARAFSRRMEWARRQGQDISSEAVQEEAGAGAYIDANRAVFMNDNLATQSYQMVLHFLRAKDAEGLVTALQVGMPIVKVPTNYVVSTLEYGAGGVRAPWKLMKSVGGEVTKNIRELPKGQRLKALPQLIFSRGLDGLKGEDADYIMRNASKGTMGAILFAIGYHNAENVGGFYRKDGRDETDVRHGDVRLWGVDFPHMVLHEPGIEMMQMGATFRRVQEEYAGKQRDEGYTADELGSPNAEALRASAKSMAQSIPFFDQPTQAMEALHSTGSAQKFAGSLLRSATIPVDIGRSATIFDQDPQPGGWDTTKQILGWQHSHPIKRAPKNMLQEEMIGWPGLRQMVEPKDE
jgi:hypothetical protein